MRHLYDTHCVVERLSSSPDFDAVHFGTRLGELAALAVARDIATYGNQYEDFANDPDGVLRVELSHIRDVDVRVRYGKFCETMIWGETPSFDEVADSFAKLASAALALRMDNAYDERRRLEVGEVPAEAGERRSSGLGLH